MQPYLLRLRLSGRIHWSVLNISIKLNSLKKNARADCDSLRLLIAIPVTCRYRVSVESRSKWIASYTGQDTTFTCLSTAVTWHNCFWRVRVGPNQLCATLVFYFARTQIHRVMLGTITAPPFTSLCSRFAQFILQVRSAAGII